MNKMLFCIALTFSILESKAQVTHQQTYWTRIVAKLKINDKWMCQIQADNRRFFGENKQLQFITHLEAHRKLGKNTEGSLGFTFSDVWQGNLPVPEVRPFQEFYFFQKLSEKWRLSHRFRTEQRWFHNYKNEVLTEGYNFKFRFRYMPRLEYKMTAKWTLKANSEFMYHTDDFDQNRYYGGVEYRFNKKTGLELGYLKVYQKRSGGKGYYDRDNLRVTFYKDFVLH